MWSLLEIELQECSPKPLRDVVLSMRGQHELWFGKLLFSLVICLYESKTTPQMQEGVHSVRLRALIWPEIMLLHSVLSAYNNNPEPENAMGAEFGLADYKKLDERLRSGGSGTSPGVNRLLEELMGHGDPVAEFLLGLEEGCDSDLIRDASDCGFALASCYGAPRADSIQRRDSSASNVISSKLEKQPFLRRITLEPVSDYFTKHEDALDGLSRIESTTQPIFITERDWSFFAGVVHHSQELLGNPKAGGPGSDFWLESERECDHHFEKRNYPLLSGSEVPSKKLLQPLKERYELLKRCEYRLRLADAILSHRKEHLFNGLVEAAKLFEALLKACVVHFNRNSDRKRIRKSYVSPPREPNEVSQAKR